MSQVLNYLLERPQGHSGPKEELVFWVSCTYANKESTSLLGGKCCDWDPVGQCLLEFSGKIQVISRLHKDFIFFPFFFSSFLLSTLNPLVSDVST